MFGLDGTLVDTRRDIAEAVNHILQLHARRVAELATVISWVGAGVATSKGHAHHRIEHAQFLRPQDVERFANLGITASMQPSHLDLDVGKLKTVFPTPHPRSYAFKSLLGSGAELNSGSDAPVENPDALKGIAFAAFRTQISWSCRGTSWETTTHGQYGRLGSLPRSWQATSHSKPEPDLLVLDGRSDCDA